jgi:phosphoribosyl-ATP pyrophosphohydrolase/phosphoribosyl-AMP cyclohydrolase
VTALQFDVSALDFTKGAGLVTVVAQDAHTGSVLMVAYADREALEKTIETGEMHYRSRSRGLWHKGATSGNTQRVVRLSADCDGDTVLALVDPAGPACHTGADTCFGGAAAGGGAAVGGAAGRSAPERSAVTRSAAGGGAAADSPSRASSDVLARLDATIASRAAALQSRSAPSPDTHDIGDKPSYTQRLLKDRNLRLKKLGEEAAELITACADGDRARALEEGADVLYHMAVALQAVGATIADLKGVLEERE